jgi:hypothetical protein
VPWVRALVGAAGLVSLCIGHYWVVRLVPKLRRTDEWSDGLLRTMAIWRTSTALLLGALLLAAAAARITAATYGVVALLLMTPQSAHGRAESTKRAIEPRLRKSLTKPSAFSNCPRRPIAKKSR